MEPLHILWVVDFEYSSRLHHGAILRYVNYSRELQKRGHRVYLAVLLESARERESRAWFDELKYAGVITSYIELPYNPPVWRRRLAAFGISFVLHRERRKTAAAIQTAINHWGVNTVIVSNRRLMFLSTALLPRWCSVIDFCDCFTLYIIREIIACFRNRQYSRMLSLIRPALRSAIEERYYGRRSARNIVVSPVDKMALDRITGRPGQTTVVLNGIDVRLTSTSEDKDPDRLIFTGNMNFGPNHDAAIWFLDEVFPLVLKQHPRAYVVIAGANPTDDLRVRENAHVHVTGYVENLNHEIANSALYVAPLISGGGFKNKIIEALANRTYVAGTSLAVEFLDPVLRELILVSDTPSGLADAIASFLNCPTRYEANLTTLYQTVRSAFTWSSRTDELVDCIASAHKR